MQNFLLFPEGTTWCQLPHLLPSDGWTTGTVSEILENRNVSIQICEQFANLYKKSCCDFDWDWVKPAAQFGENEQNSLSRTQCVSPITQASFPAISFVVLSIPSPQMSSADIDFFYYCKWNYGFSISNTVSMEYSWIVLSKNFWDFCM